MGIAFLGDEFLGKKFECENTVCLDLKNEQKILKQTNQCLGNVDCILK